MKHIKSFNTRLRSSQEWDISPVGHCKLVTRPQTARILVQAENFNTCDRAVHRIINRKNAIQRSTLIFNPQEACNAPLEHLHSWHAQQCANSKNNYDLLRQCKLHFQRPKHALSEFVGNKLLVLCAQPRHSSHCLSMGLSDNISSCAPEAKL